MCNCIDLTNQALAREGYEAALSCNINLETGVRVIGIPLKHLGLPRTLPSIIASHCPLCGERYEWEGANDAPPRPDV